MELIISIIKVKKLRHKVDVICVGRQFLKGSPQLLDPTQSRTCSRQKHPWQKECRLIFIKYIPGIFHVLYIVTLWWFEVKKKESYFLFIYSSSFFTCLTIWGKSPKARLQISLLHSPWQVSPFWENVLIASGKRQVGNTVRAWNQLNCSFWLWFF